MIIIPKKKSIFMWHNFINLLLFRLFRKEWENERQCFAFLTKMADVRFSGFLTQMFGKETLHLEMGEEEGREGKGSGFLGLDNFGG